MAICVSCPLSAICLSCYGLLYFIEKQDVPLPGSSLYFSTIRVAASARICWNDDTDDDILLDVPLHCPGREGSNYEGKPHMP